jgi:hypothetical protein
VTDEAKQSYEAFLDNCRFVDADFLPDLNSHIKMTFLGDFVWEIEDDPNHFILSFSGGGWREPTAHLLDATGSVVEHFVNFNDFKRGRWIRWPSCPLDREGASK